MFRHGPGAQWVVSGRDGLSHIPVRFGLTPLFVGNSWTIVPKVTNLRLRPPLGCKITTHVRGLLVRTISLHLLLHLCFLALLLLQFHLKTVDKSILLGQFFGTFHDLRFQVRNFLQMLSSDVANLIFMISILSCNFGIGFTEFLFQSLNLRFKLRFLRIIPWSGFRRLSTSFHDILRLLVLNLSLNRCIVLILISSIQHTFGTSQSRNFLRALQSGFELSLVRIHLLLDGSENSSCDGRIDFGDLSILNHSKHLLSQFMIHRSSWQLLHHWLIFRCYGPFFQAKLFDDDIALDGNLNSV